MKFKMSNKAYDILKFIVTIALPAIGVFFNTLVLAWGWDLPVEAINLTFGAVITLLGTLLGISNAQYKAQKE